MATKQTDDGILRVISRKSNLALRQVEEVFSRLPELKYEIKSIDSFGDRNKRISLLGEIAPDFFTRELDRAILEGEADLAVHSAKDLPYPLAPGTEVYALTEATDNSDSLVSTGNLTLAELPQGSKIGTSSPVRKKEILILRPDLVIVPIRGTIEERIALVDDGSIDALVVATCALQRLGMEHRVAEKLPFATHPLQGKLAITGKAENHPLKNLFIEIDSRKNYGHVTLVGFGPGHPDLLTIAADKALAAADIILHDALLDENALTKYRAEKIPVGKRRGHHSHSQEQINELLYRHAAAGKNVVRLKGGDPMVFAHGREELDFLQSRFIEVDVIPGISSGIALSSYTRIPLTHRGLASSVAFVTGHSAEKFQTPDADTLIYYMGGANIARIARRLVENGRSETTPAALVYNVSLPDQQTFFSTVGQLQDTAFRYPTPVIIIIGEVVRFATDPSAAGKVLHTGTQSADYRRAAHVTHNPLIRIRKIENNDPLHAAIHRLHTFHWIVFTSRYGVRYFFEALKETKTDLRDLKGIKIASVGSTTTEELGNYFLRPDMESETHSAEGILDYFREHRITGKKILLPRSDKGLQELPRDLLLQGNKVYDIPVYHNTINEEAEIFDLSDFSQIVFPSPSTVEAFTEIYGRIPDHVRLVVRGKTTAAKLESIG